MWGKFNRELIVTTLIAVLVLAVAFGLNFSTSQKEILERQTYDYLLEATNYTKVVLHTEIKRQNELLDIVVKNAPQYEGQKDNLLKLLDTVSNTGYFSHVGLTYRGEKTLLSGGSSVDILERDYYKRALAGETVIEAPVTSAVSDKKVVILAKPFYKDGQVAGVVHEAYDLNTAAKTLLAGLNMQEDRTTMIATMQGDIIMGIGQGPQENVYKFLQSKVIGSSMTVQQLQKAIANKESGAFHYVDTFGETQYVVFAPVDVNDWYTFQIVSGTALLADQQMLNKVAREVMVKYFLLLCLCFAVILYIWRQVEKERLNQINAEIEGLRLTAGLIEGCMFEYDLKACKFLIAKNTSKQNANETQALQVLGHIFDESLTAKNSVGLQRYFHPDDLDTVQKALAELRSAGRIVFQGRLLKGASDYHWYRFYMALILDDKQHCKRVLGNILDINDSQSRFEQMQREAERDALTGVYNRAVFEKQVSEILEESRGRHAFFLLDIDDFKNVNDSKGHAFGDTVLCSAVSCLESSFRSTDLLGRIGGDEFAVFMRDIGNEENALEKARQICSLYDECGSGEDFKISCSIGVAFCEAGGDETFAELYLKADTALYKAKDKGKNMFVVFDASMLP